MGASGASFCTGTVRLMKKAHLLTPLLVATLALAGCASGPAEHPTAPTNAATSTPSSTPTPTPKVLTMQEAGAKYIQLVCPANKAGAALQAAFNAQNLAQIQQAAAVARDADRARALAFSDPMLIWPEPVRADLKTLVDSDYAIVAVVDAISKATTLDQANSVTAPADKSGEASQRIRAILGIPADTSAGC